MRPHDFAHTTALHVSADHRNSSMSDWLVQEFLLGNTGLNSKFVDGYFLDDYWAGDGAWGCNGSPADGASPAGGPTEMSANCTRDMGLSASDIVDISTHWHTNYVTAKAVAVAAKGFEWHLLQKISTPPAGPVCETFFRRACAENSVEHDSALFVQFGGNSGNGRAPNATNDLATFLLVRGKFAWIGHDFVGAFCLCRPFCLCLVTSHMCNPIQHTSSVVALQQDARCGTRRLVAQGSFTSDHRCSTT